MHYNLEEGMQPTWRDRFGSITEQLTGRNVLPIAVAAIAALWIGLIFTAMQQTGPANPGTPSDLTGTKSSPGMAVAGTPANNPSLATPGSSDSLAATQVVQSTANAAAMNSSTAATENTVAPTVAPIVGGRGGGGDDSGGGGSPAVTVPAPELPAPVPDPVPVVDLTVDTPLTPDPIIIDVDPDNGLQLDPGLGL
ncbi:MAG: hypothetical protein JWN82_230 [Candidatus Saccharibacteria bacterium]|nr:hypothetical protein [Candidatus Saccharibacteria bacterium]